MGLARTTLTILAVILFRGASSEAFDRLWQAHFVANLAFPRLGQLSSIKGETSGEGRNAGQGVAADGQRYVDAAGGRMLRCARHDIACESRAGRSERVIYPFGLYASAGFWYCACRDYRRGADLARRRFDFAFLGAEAGRVPDEGGVIATLVPAKEVEQDHE